MAHPPTLLEQARLVARNAYAPYSRFRVGAAVRSGDRTFIGCNVENSTYGLTICAERNAIFQAIAGGCTSIDALAITCIDAAPGAPAATSMPCGACRQVMSEFGVAGMSVEVDGIGTFMLSDLLPSPFKLT